MSDDLGNVGAALLAFFLAAYVLLMTPLSGTLNGLVGVFFIAVGGAFLTGLM